MAGRTVLVSRIFLLKKADMIKEGKEIRRLSRWNGAALLNRNGRRLELTSALTVLGSTSTGSAVAPLARSAGRLGCPRHCPAAAFGEKEGQLAFNVLPPTVCTDHGLVRLVHRANGFEFVLAVQADIFINGHGDASQSCGNRPNRSRPSGSSSL